MWCLYQERKFGSTSGNKYIIHHINRIKVKNTATLHAQNSSKYRDSINIPQHCKDYANPTDKIILTGENLKAFALKPGTRQGCPLLPLLFKIFLETLARAVRQNKVIKGI